jgi:hypothetical protein
MIDLVSLVEITGNPLPIKKLTAGAKNTQNVLVVVSLPR